MPFDARLHAVKIHCDIVRLAVVAILLSSPQLDAATNTTAKVRTASARSDKLAREVLEELNLARTKPKEYARFVEQFLAKFIDDKTYMDGNAKMTSKEGKKAVQEAIDFLKAAKPIGPLTLSKGLSDAALDHVEDIGPKGLMTHDGTDDSKMEDRMSRYGKWEKTCGENIAAGPNDARPIVIQLIVDDGVPGRGHRKNIYNPDYHVVGVAGGKHKQYRYVCVMDFAGGYKEKNKRSQDKNAKETDPEEQ